jgi:transglutaminase-like putative cysteine protease
MNKNLSSFFLLLFLNGFLSYGAKHVSQAAVPSWVKPISIPNNDKVAERDVSGGYHYLLLDDQRHVATNTFYHHVALNIINDVGVQNASEIETSYDPGYESLIIHFIRIKRAGVTLNKLDMKEIKTLQRETDLESRIYDGRFSAYINLKDIRKGDIVEYAYSITGRNPVYNNKFFEEFATEYSVPVTQMVYRLVCPTLRKLQFKQHLTNNTPQISESGNNQIYEWDLSCLKPKEEEGSIPAWFMPYGFVEITEYQSWEEVVNWALNLYPKDGPLSAELKEKIAEFNQGSPEKKILATLHFVQDEIRYMGFEVGVNSHKPNDPNKVFAQRFGDCKDKALLMCRMLSEMGIEAYPNLVNTTRTKMLDSWLPSPSNFNHVTVCVKVNGQTYWFDQTDSYQAGKLNTIQYPKYYKTLIVKPGEKGITHIQNQRISNIKVHETFVVTDTVSPIILRVISTYTGSEADNIRYIFSSKGIGDIEKEYTAYYKSLYGDVTLDDKISFTDDPEENVFKVFEDYSIKDLWTLTEGRKQIEVSASLLFNAIQLENIKTRKMPFALDFPCDYEQKLEVKFPMAIGIKEEEETIEDKHFKYTYHFSNEGNGSIVILKYNYQTLTDVVEPENTFSFFTKIAEVKRLSAYYISWGESGSTPTLNEANMNWMMVLGALLGSGGYVFLFLFLFKKDIDPRHEVEYAQEIGGWLVLVVISLIITFFINLAQVFSSEYFNLTAWGELTTPGKTMYHPLWGLFLTGELLIKIGLIFFILFLIILFVKRRSSFPLMFIIYIGSTLGYLVFETFLSYVLPGAESYQSTVFSEWAKVLIYGAIWIPYMLTSWRVRETFVFTYNPLKQKNLSSPEEPIRVENEPDPESNFTL